jgi:hypothetical protein
MSGLSLKKALWRSAGIYLGLLLLTCLILGFVHMFARAVTLDSVRGIDFKLIHAALEGRQLDSDADRELIGRVTGVLATSSGYAFYPMAVVDTSQCVENNREPHLCLRFPDLAGLQANIEQGETRVRYGVRTLATVAGEYFFVAPVSGADAWLVGQAGRYLSVGDRPFGKELAFLREVTHYVSPAGFKKMLEKSKWTWVVAFILFAMMWSLHAWSLCGAERRHSALARQNREIERDLAGFQEEIARLASQKNEIEMRLSGMETESEEEKAMIYEELAEKERELATVVEDRNMVALERDNLANKLNKTRRERATSLQKAEAEQAFKELHEIRKLWLIEPDWPERYNIEETLAADSLGRAPFTEFIAFVRMEWFLRTMCKRKGIERSTNSGRIEALGDNGFISRRERRLLEEANRARNAWFHEGRHASRDLVNRLIEYLAKRTNPEVRPMI